MSRICHGSPNLNKDSLTKRLQERRGFQSQVFHLTGISPIADGDRCETQRSGSDSLRSVKTHPTSELVSEKSTINPTSSTYFKSANSIPSVKSYEIPCKITVKSHRKSHEKTKKTIRRSPPNRAAFVRTFSRPTSLNLEAWENRWQIGHSSSIDG